MKKAAREHAQKLIRDHGHAACDKAHEAVRAARRSRNGRLQRYLEKVAHEVAKCMPSDAGRDARIEAI